jgi:hypothetical protein
MAPIDRIKFSPSKSLKKAGKASRQSITDGLDSIRSSAQSLAKGDSVKLIGSLEKNLSNGRVASVSTFLIFGVVMLTVLHYLSRMRIENCSCALTTRHSLLEKLYMSLFSLSIVEVILTLSSNHSMSVFLSIVGFVLYAFTVYQSYHYLIELRASPCACAQKSTQIALVFHTMWGIFGFFVLPILLLAYAVVIPLVSAALT